MRRQALVVGTIVTTILLLFHIEQGPTQQTLRVRVDRWLELRRSAGTVTREQGTRSQPARIGDRLQSVGDGITTGKSSTATLVVDTEVGFIDVSEQTKMRVQALNIAPDNGRITRLEVTQGQARLRVRRFTHQGSELEIRTPASLSGVRGTEFGINVQPNGKTGLAVREGKVVTTALGQTVTVDAGFQNFTIPGQSPSLSVPLRDDTQLRYQLERIIERGVRLVRLVGQVDPVNQVVVDGVPQVTDRNGRFTTNLRPVPSYFKMQVIVTTPLGKQQVYDLALR